MASHSNTRPNSLIPQQIPSLLCATPRSPRPCPSLLGAHVPRGLQHMLPEIRTLPNINNFSILKSTTPLSFSAAQAQNPVPKHSGDYASVSSVSSYANSIMSSNVTLSSSTTDGSSAPSSLFDHKPHEECFHRPAQEASSHHDILALETKILADSGEPQDESRIVIKGNPSYVQSKTSTFSSNSRSFILHSTRV